LQSLNLFCLPYAGGNSYSYRPLEKHLPEHIRLAGIEIPGRGLRAREPLIYSLDALANDIFGQLKPRLGEGPYALFGHSMGAALCFLCLRRIAAAGLAYPQMVFLSGKSAPSVNENQTRHLLPRDAFVEMLRDLGGCPPEILDEEELIDYFEPILRADFQAVETWRTTEQPPLPVPFVVLHGQDDQVTREEAMAWAKETAGGFRFHEFAGDHFFIQRHWASIAQLICTHLAEPYGAKAHSQANNLTPHEI